MSAEPGDRARASVLVKLGIEETFRAFTEEIDVWWRRGARFRAAGPRRGVIRLEPGVGGRLVEAIETKSGERVVQTGAVTVWEPPERLAFEWRAVNFAPDEKTLVEIDFARAASGTLVTVTHSGWSRIRPDHPVRHGLDRDAFVRSMGTWWGDLLTALRRHAAEPQR